jgi:hypothetical protein
MAQIWSGAVLVLRAAPEPATVQVGTCVGQWITTPPLALQIVLDLCFEENRANIPTVENLSCFPRKLWNSQILHLYYYLLRII